MRDDSNEPRAANERTDETEQADPIESSEPAEPIEPIESTHPTDPIESTEPLVAMESNESSDLQDQRDPKSRLYPRLPNCCETPARDAGAGTPRRRREALVASRAAGSGGRDDFVWSVPPRRSYCPLLRIAGKGLRQLGPSPAYGPPGTVGALGGGYCGTFAVTSPVEGTRE
jgi:hypothetical protein